MSDVIQRPDPTDIIGVKSRVSWAAIFAGGMVAITLYVVLMLLGVALLGEAVARDAQGSQIGLGSAIYTAFTLLISFFFGGWATSRLAVGESKVEAVLYGLILWGLLFVGMLALLASGVKAGFSGMVGDATGAYAERTTDRSGESLERMTAFMKDSGLPEEQLGQFRAMFGDSSDPAVRGEVVQSRRAAAWYSLLGVAVSLFAVIFGTLVGSGDVPVPIPVIGVKRRVTVTRT